MAWRYEDQGTAGAKFADPLIPRCCCAGSVFFAIVDTPGKLRDVRVRGLYAA